MAKTIRFTFMCDPEDRQRIQLLAQSLQRSESDAVRFVVRESASQIGAPAGAAPAPRVEHFSTKGAPGASRE